MKTWLAQGAEDRATGLLRLLEPDGTPTALLSDANVEEPELARRLLRGMVRIRQIDERLLTLQRQGRIGFYGTASGQEASVVGTAAAMEPQDWLVPALREPGAGLLRGMALSDYVSQILGNAADPTKGRQMPCHASSVQSNHVSMSSCIGGQLLHAVGVAWAMKLKGDDAVCVGHVGDGATSTGDFGVALNFAGVGQVPAILVCQNNQWAISTPGHKQTASESIALKGLVYGLTSLRVDGNDALAVYAATRYARELARRGEGPVFLELLTYRVGAHSTSDDPSRYRDESVTEIWKTERDPIVRLATWMEGRGWLEPDEVRSIASEYEAEILAVLAEQEPIGSPARASLFEDVFEEPTWALAEQSRASR